MSALINFTEADPWFTNSHTWQTISSLALAQLDEKRRDEYEWYINEVGLDFTLMSNRKAVEVATWFSQFVKDVLASADADPTWTSEDGRQHFANLIANIKDEEVRRTLMVAAEPEFTEPIGD